jgi:O-antigen ligase
MLLKTIVLYFAILMVVRTKEQLKLLVYIILAFGFITSAATLILSKFQIYTPGIANPYRLSSFFGGIGDAPNMFGAMMVGLLPLPLAYLKNKSPWWKKTFLILVALSFMLCITRTRSRGAFVGLVIVLAIIGWEHRRRLGALVLMGLLALFTYTHTHYAYWERVDTLKSSETTMREGEGGRVMQMKFAMEIMKLRPLTGVGLGNFVNAKVMLLSMNPEYKVTTQVAHNSYLELGAEIGILGMILFSYLVVRSILDCRNIEKSFSGNEEYKSYYFLSRGIWVGLVAIAVTFFFLSEQYNSMLYQWFAIITILEGIAREKQAIQVAH